MLTENQGTEPDLSYLEEEHQHLPYPCSEGPLLAQLQHLWDDPVVKWLLRSLEHESHRMLHSEVKRRVDDVGAVLGREYNFGYAEGLLRMSELIPSTIKNLIAKQQNERSSDIDRSRLIRPE